MSLRIYKRVTRAYKNSEKQTTIPVNNFSKVFSRLNVRNFVTKYCVKLNKISQVRTITAIIIKPNWSGDENFTPPQTQATKIIKYIKIFRNPGTIMVSVNCRIFTSFLFEFMVSKACLPFMRFFLKVMVS